MGLQAERPAPGSTGDSSGSATRCARCRAASRASSSTASSGAIFIDGDTGYVDWGATHPDFRRRGSQTALLNARLRHALAAGCSRVVTMTGEAVPCDPQHSYRNILRAAIRERYCRENWLPAD